MYSSRSGFTLIELMIALAVSGLIIAMTAGGFINANLKARDARRKSDLSQLGKSLELYYNDHNRYPPASSGQIAGCGATSSSLCGWGNAFEDGNDTVYFDQIPNDPQSSRTYLYRVSADGLKYQLYAALENVQDPILDRTGDGVADNYSTSCGTGVTCNYAQTSANTDGAASI